MSQTLFDLTNKTAVIIGGGSGIGEAVTLGCARQGARVVCLDINGDSAARVAATANRLARAAESGVLDIRDAAAVETTFDRIARRARQPRHRRLHAEHQRAQEDPATTPNEEFDRVRRR